MTNSSRSRDYGAPALAAGSVLSGVFAYLYIALGTREYGAEDFSGVAQLWTIWFFASAVLTFPLQHWVIQRLRADGHGGAVRAVLPRLSAVTLGLGLTVVLVTGAVGGDLFGSSEVLYPLAAGAITVGAAAMGLLRGGLAGRSRFLAAAAALGGENLVRLAAGAMVIAIGAGVGLYGLAIVSGVLVILAWPGALRFRGPAPTDVSPFAFLGNVGGGTLIAQAVLTAGPVVLSLLGGSRAEVTSLFAALALFRAPYIVALGLAIRGTAALADLAAAGRWDVLRRLRRRTTLLGMGLMVVGGALAAAVGPATLALVFGAEVDLSRMQCAGLAAGSLAALATLGLTLLQMTFGTARPVLQAWVIGLAAGLVTLSAVDIDLLSRVVVAFVVSEGAAFAAMALLDRSGGRRPS